MLVDVERQVHQDGTPKPGALAGVPDTDYRDFLIGIAELAVDRRF